MESFRLFLAGTTKTVDLQLVAADLELVLPRNILLESFNAFILELYDRAASRTDQMIMMRIWLRMLISRETVIKSPFLGESRFSKQFQCTVNGGVAYTGMYLFDPCVQFLRAQVLACVDKDLEDAVPLACRLEALDRKIFTQMF